MTTLWAQSPPRVPQKLLIFLITSASCPPPALPAHGCHKSLVPSLLWTSVPSLMGCQPLVLQFFHCTCPTKPQSRSVALHPCLGCCLDPGYKTTAAPWSSGSSKFSSLICPLWAPSLPPSLRLSLQEPSFSLLNTAPGPLLTKKKKTTPRQRQEDPCCFLPPSP